MMPTRLLLNFTVDQLKNYKWINILSVFRDKLLVSHSRHSSLSELFIINREGHYISTITTNDDTLLDAVWTNSGNIVYTTRSGNKVVRISKSGEVMATHTMAQPHYLSVSSDDCIYLADYEAGVYESTDDGISWNLVFKSAAGWHCEQVIKVTSENFDDFWTLEEDEDTGDYHLRVYSVNKRHAIKKITSEDIDVTATGGKSIVLSSFSSLAYDGNTNIFLSDHHNDAVHVFLLNGQYRCQLLSSAQLKNTPHRLAIHGGSRQLYVGQKDVVGVFQLM